MNESAAFSAAVLALVGLLVVICLVGSFVDWLKKRIWPEKYAPKKKKPLSFTDNLPWKYRQ